MVAGLSGDAGKTLVALGLALAFRRRGLEVQGFKKGPDYIDAAWLSWATGRPARNLDTWMAGFDAVRGRFRAAALRDGLNLVEGNRGVFDGVDAEGTHSTAALARALDAPVVLVVPVRKTTRTAAAPVLGCLRMDPALRVAGVILNQVAGTRHETVAREAIEKICGVPVLGAIPHVDEASLLPGRHLGLVTPSEHRAADSLADRLEALVSGHVDVERVNELCGSGEFGTGRRSGRPGPTALEGSRPRVVIGYFRDSAFSFYYPENLEALESLGARLVPISSLAAPALPRGLDALYVGGGFPETHAARLSANRGLLDSIAAEASRGLPIYAECGGLMLLAREITWQGQAHPMAGVLPFDVEVLARPQGHGYSQLRVDRPNPFFPVGAVLKGHEFHYSRVARNQEAVNPESRTPSPELSVCAVERGTGLGGGRDGVVINNVWASYVHLHADGAPGWAPAVIQAARRLAAGDR